MVSVAEEKRERSTILCNIYPSLPPHLPRATYSLLCPCHSSYDLPTFYPHCRHISIYRPALLRVSSSSLIHRLFLLSAHHLFFVLARRTLSTRGTYRLRKTAGASFCLLRDNYRRSLRRRLHPKAVIPVGVIDSRNFRTKTATRNRIDFVVASR